MLEILWASVSSAMLALVCCSLIKRDPPPICPKISWKCWVAFFVGGIAAYLFLLIWGAKGAFSPELFVAAHFTSVAAGCFTARILCPI